MLLLDVRDYEILLSVLEGRVNEITKYLQKPDANAKYVGELTEDRERMYKMLQAIDKLKEWS